MYLLDDRVLFSGDSLAWSMRDRTSSLFAMRAGIRGGPHRSLEKLAAYRFEWLLPGHGWPALLPAEEMNARLRRSSRMRES